MIEEVYEYKNYNREDTEKISIFILDYCNFFILFSGTIFWPVKIYYPYVGGIFNIGYSMFICMER